MYRAVTFDRHCQTGIRPLNRKILQKYGAIFNMLKLGVLVIIRN